MKKEINYKIGFSDGEITSYSRDQNNLVVKVKTWNDTYLIITFLDVVGIIDYGIGDISNFVEETEETSFLKIILNRVYELIPEAPPYRLFQFLDLDDNPSLEIVAVSQSIYEET